MKYKLNDRKIFMDISDGIAVIINSETGIYYGMNSFGTVVFEALSTGVDTVEIVSQLKNFKNASVNMEDRFNEFLNTVMGYELLVPGEEANALSIDESIAQNDGYVLEVVSYDDAQEMLLADPIHEVNEEDGWAPEKEVIGYSKEETRKRERKVK